jgi:hypothetical protein
LYTEPLSSVYNEPIVDMQAEAERAALPAAVPRSSPVQSPPIKRDDLDGRLTEALSGSFRLSRPS